MLGQLAFGVSDGAEPVAGVDVAGFVVVPVVAAFAHYALPATRAPATASTDPPLRVGLMYDSRPLARWVFSK
mgnify:CR=1 FL=1